MMFDPTSMIAAGTATRRHVLSARPDAPTAPEPPPRRRRAMTRRLSATALRRLSATALRRLADRLEPCHADTFKPAKT